MKFQVFSDLHLELYSDSYCPKFDAVTDTLFLVGDIGKLSCKNYKLFMDYVSKTWKQTFYVLGNHEYYHSKKDYVKLNKEYHDFFSSYGNITLLDKKKVIYEGIEIIGLTMWTDISSITDIESLSDFKAIKIKNDKKWTIPMTKEYFIDLHKQEKKWLLENYDPTKKTIIVTHFPLMNETSHPKFSDSIFKSYFENDFKLFNNVQLINIYGHTHYSIDKTIEKIRIISNQQGYSDEHDTLFDISIFYDA